MIEFLKRQGRKLVRWWTGATPLAEAMSPQTLLAASAGAQGATPQDMVTAELAYIDAYRARRPPASAGDNGGQPLFGLALSGGGVRSASIALGVLQALARASKLHKFDYLSTVSGGGYIGSALTWFTSRQYNGAAFGTAAATFPYSTDPPFQPIASPLGNAQKLLVHLRQHANYLLPGQGINAASGVALVLRGILVNLFIWLPTVCVVMLALILARPPVPPSRTPELFIWMLEGAGGLIGLLALLGLGYSLMSGKERLKTDGWVARLLNASAPDAAFVLGPFSLTYRFRRFFDSRTRWIIILFAAALLVGLLPLADQALRGLIGAVGLLSIAGGAASGLWTFWQSRQATAGKIPGFVPAFGAFLLLYGVALTAYHAALILAMAPTTSWWAAWIRPTVLWCLQVVPGAGDMAIRLEEQAGDLVTQFGLSGHLPANPRAVAFLIGWAVIALGVAWFVNLNYTTIHRYYRDRLMESFLPDLQVALANRTGAAKAADGARLSAMCDARAPRGPYHLVNCNVMLGDSAVTEWRLRGGDSFILSPRYCGSSATGWIWTEDWMDDSMTLSTAMAISGAAANPGTGSGGVGPTRNPVVSMLMALLNLRLGYWVPNPRRGRVAVAMPNHFNPALLELLGWSRGEESRILQLSDGGHFDNLGLYELIRRKVPLILVCDGTADPDFAFTDLLTLLPRIREDFGTTIAFDPAFPVDQTLPAPAATGTPRYPAGAMLAGRGFALAEIHYPGTAQRGVLIYLKAAALVGMETELLGYKGKAPDFPNESTLDQFYSDAKFEAHRAVGYALADGLIAALAARAPATVPSTVLSNPVMAWF